MTAAARLRPSSADRIVRCRGSALMESLYPVDDSDAARDGHAVHWVGGLMLIDITGQITDDSVPPRVGDIAPNGVVINIEMLEGAALWVDTVVSRGTIGQVEQTIMWPALHSDNWGTPDHWWWDAPTRTLYIDDLKYGFRYVEVRGNWQLINYAALILNSLGLMNDPTVRVVLTICQPRSYHRGGFVRSHTYTVAELQPLWRQLVVAFNEASEPSPPVTPDPEACRDCKGRWGCEGAINAGYIGVDMAYKSEPLEMSPKALAREYRMLLHAETYIKARRTGIEERVMQVIRRQQVVPGFKLEGKAGRKVWKEDAEANGIVDICAAYNVDAKPTGVGLTPLQAVKAGVPEVIVRQFSRTNSGALELVEDDGSDAARIFKGIS